MLQTLNSCHSATSAHSATSGGENDGVEGQYRVPNSQDTIGKRMFKEFFFYHFFSPRGVGSGVTPGLRGGKCAPRPRPPLLRFFWKMIFSKEKSFGIPTPLDPPFFWTTGASFKFYYIILREITTPSLP